MKNPFKKVKKTEEKNEISETNKKTTSLFFWKKQKTETKIEELMAAVIKYGPKLKEILQPQYQTPTLVSDGESIGKMYDFFIDYTGNFNTRGMVSGIQNNWNQATLTVTGGAGEMMSRPLLEGELINHNIQLGQNGIDLPELKTRIEAKPKDVLFDLETVPTPFNIQNLDELIELFKNKSALSNQRYAKAQIDGFIQRLENRKHYESNLEFYTSFSNTTDEKIDNLLQKYKLVMKTEDLFVPSFPKEAIDVMKKYSDVTATFTKEKLVFYVIAEEKDFEKKFKKLDPILLVQSPFGFFWQILGAWDKEMLLLSEL